MPLKLGLFAALQIADVITTLIGLRLGGSEQSPFIAWLMRATHDPLTALLLVKLLGVGLVAFAVWRGRMRLVTKANVIFAVVVAWNAAQIGKALYL
jgi:hypothetical protein